MQVLRSVLCSLLLLLPAAPAFAAAATGPGPHVFSATSQRGYAYQLTFAATRLEAMQPLPATVQVTDPAGVLVSGAKLACDLTMPAMAMPLNSPSLKEGVEPGRYNGVVLLTMGGLWEMGVTAIYANGAQDSVVFSFVGVNPGSGEDRDAVSKRLEELFHEKDKETGQVKK